MNFIKGSFRLWKGKALVKTSNISTEVLYSSLLIAFLLPQRDSYSYLCLVFLKKFLCSFDDLLITWQLSKNFFPTPWRGFFFFKSSPKDMFTDFRERGKEKEREKHRCEKHQSVVSCTCHNWELNPQPRQMLWPGIEPVTQPGPPRGF